MTDEQARALIKLWREEAALHDAAKAALAEGDHKEPTWDALERSNHSEASLAYRFCAHELEAVLNKGQPALEAVVRSRKALR